VYGLMRVDQNFADRHNEEMRREHQAGVKPRSDWWRRMPPEFYEHQERREQRAVAWFKEGHEPEREEFNKAKQRIWNLEVQEIRCEAASLCRKLWKSSLPTKVRERSLFDRSLELFGRSLEAVFEFTFLGSVKIAMAYMWVFVFILVVVAPLFMLYDAFFGSKNLLHVPVSLGWIFLTYRMWRG
jgi:hypothetical protein